MNRLSGKIAEVLVDGQLSLVTLLVADIRLQVAVIDTPQQSSHLTVGSEVEALFKETEVILAKDLHGTISLENRIPGTVQSIEFEELFCKVLLDTNVGTISAIITSRSARQLDLAIKMDLIAFVKTNEIMLSK